MPQSLQDTLFMYQMSHPRRDAMSYPRRDAMSYPRRDAMSQPVQVSHPKRDEPIRKPVKPQLRYQSKPRVAYRPSKPANCSIPNRS